MFEYLENNPHLLVNGFHSACIPQSIDAGQPIITTEDNTEDTDLIDSEDDNYTDSDNDSDDDTKMKAITDNDAGEQLI